MYRRFRWGRLVGCGGVFSGGSNGGGNKIDFFSSFAEDAGDQAQPLRFQLVTSRLRALHPWPYSIYFWHWGVSHALGRGRFFGWLRYFLDYSFYPSCFVQEVLFSDPRFTGRYLQRLGLRVTSVGSLGFDWLPPRAWFGLVRMVDTIVVVQRLLQEAHWRFPEVWATRGVTLQEEPFALSEGSWSWVWWLLNESVWYSQWRLGRFSRSRVWRQWWIWSGIRRGVGFARGWLEAERRLVARRRLWWRSGLVRSFCWLNRRYRRFYRRGHARRRFFLVRRLLPVKVLGSSRLREDVGSGGERGRFRGSLMTVRSLFQWDYRFGLRSWRVRAGLFFEPLKPRFYWFYNRHFWRSFLEDLFIYNRRSVIG